jgi:hypothetical protein
MIGFVGKKKRENLLGFLEITVRIFSTATP